MASERATPRSCSYGGAKSKSKDTEIVPDFERGSRYAGWLLGAMFLFMALGAVLWGW
jgi:hypothetical protein